MDDGGSPTTGMIILIILLCIVIAVLIVMLAKPQIRKAVSDRIRKLSGKDSEDVTEEEIISMVNEGHEHGVLEANEAEMIHNIFEFGDKDAKDIMTHRKNIIAVDGNVSFQEMLDYLVENNYSRYPVYIEDIDNIIGVLHIKEALAFCQKKDVYDKAVKDIDGLIREVDFIPETRNLNTLFAKMQTEKSHMVIVVDEYGQTSGIVAMEDILEEIVGNIQDEHDEEEVMIEKLPDGSYIMDGMTPAQEALDLLGIELPDADEFETLNGLLISLLDRIPSDEEKLELDACGYHFKVLRVENKMIRKVKITKLPEKTEQSEADSSCQNTQTVLE